VGDPDRSRVEADQDVHPVVVAPQFSDLHPVQVGRLSQGEQNVFAEERVHRGTLSRRLVRVPFILLFRWHRFSRS
jgi:hypothetical protein